MLAVGDRVVFVQCVERYPHFIVEVGAETCGTVVIASEKEFGVELDHYLPGADEWDNVVYWYYPNGDGNPNEDLARTDMLAPEGDKNERWARQKCESWISDVERRAAPRNAYALDLELDS